MSYHTYNIHDEIKDCNFKPINCIKLLDRNITPVQKLGSSEFNKMIFSMHLDELLFKCLDNSSKKLSTIIDDNYYTGLLK